MNFEALNTLLNQANELSNAGNYDHAEQLAASVLAEIELAGYSDESQSITERKTLHCSALFTLATTINRRGDQQAALSLAHASRDIAEEYALTESNAKAWNMIGSMQYSLGSYDKSLESYEHALAVYGELGDTSTIATITWNVGIIFQYLGYYNKSFECYEQALALHKELGEKSSEALVIGSIAIVYTVLGSYDKALEYYEQALALHNELGEKAAVARVTGNIGNLYYDIGSYDKALECYGQALTANEELGRKFAVAGVIGNIGNVYKELGSYDKALNYYEQALAGHKELVDKSGVARVIGNIGNVYTLLGSFDRAFDCLEQALALYKELGEKSGVAVTTGNIGNIYTRLGSYDKALEYFEQALAAHMELGEKLGVANTTGNIGTLYANTSYHGFDAAIAEEFLSNAIALSDEIGDKAALVEFHKSLADLFENENKGMQALGHFKTYIEIKEEVNIEETIKLDSIREQQKVIELAKATAAAKLTATTTLLHKVLPESIATRIIAGEQEIADYFPSVSILFADIAGFTPISAGMPAYVVVRFLNYIFGTFDTIMKKHGCEKIKTIGDGYMAVAGAPIECADHAQRMALAALEMQQDIMLPDEFRAYLPEGVNFGIRIGLHTGSVVGGVIGDERFVYDIYSDAVNTAARMESHGEPDKIHVSEEFKQAFLLGAARQEQPHESPLSPKSLHFQERGEMEIKGKGRMNTYFLEHII